MPRRNTTRLRWLVLALALALIAAACNDAGEPEGDTLVWAYEQEPTTLNPMVTDGADLSTSQVALASLLPLWVTMPDFSYAPSVLLESAEPDDGPPFSVRYSLNPEAQWSDGEPITADDVLFTVSTLQNEDWDIVSRAGYELVDLGASEALDEHTVRLVFTETYAPWRTLFSLASGAILPRHALEGEDFDNVWTELIDNPKTGEPIASGPFLTTAREPGRQIEFTRNDRYFGEGPHLGRVVMRFIPDIDARLQLLRGAEIHLMDPQPQLDLLRQLDNIDGVQYETDSGPMWEHLDFQHEVPGLDQVHVRRAIAMGIDRDGFIEEFIRPMNPDAGPLNSLMYMANDTNYTDHLGDIVPHDPDGAVALLEENGCERGDDEIFVCDGVRLSFDWTAITDNERRQLFFEISQQQLREIGVEVNAAFTEAIGEAIVGGNFELINFGWSGSPDPADNVELYKCDGAQNFHRHCPSPEVNDLLEATHLETDPQRRAAMMNEAGRLLAEQVPILPLFQAPSIVVWTEQFTGFELNTTQWGTVWNAAEWRRAES